MFAALLFALIVPTPVPSVPPPVLVWREEYTTMPELDLFRDDHVCGVVSAHGKTLAEGYDVLTLLSGGAHVGYGLHTFKDLDNAKMFARNDCF